MKRVALLALGALLAGCGSAKPAADAAELVPPSALAYVSLDTDLGGAPHALDRFPFGASTLRAVRRELRLRPSMGKRVEVALFKAGFVELVQPPDEKRFEATLRARDLHARIRGWTVVTEKPALLDLVRRHKERLADLPAYKQAWKLLPGDAAVRAYAARTAAGLVTRSIPTSVPGIAGAVPRAPRWASAAVRTNGDELTLELHAKGAAGPAGASTSALVSRIPADSVLAIGFDGATRSSAFPGSLRVGGVHVRDVAHALGGPSVGYVRGGLPFPEVTLASKPKDPKRAVRAVARLIRELGRPKGPPVPTTVDGVTLQDVALGAIDLYYGVVDGMVVVSNSTDAVSALRGRGGKLEVQGLPDATNGFVYLDAARALPALAAFAKLANQTVPAEVDDYLKPLKTLVLYGTRDRDVQTVVAVVQTR